MAYSALAMLYATHVIEGERTIEQVPKALRSQVEKVVNDAVKKQEDAE
ncbi:CD1375 family protein [Enterococcus rotai]